MINIMVGILLLVMSIQDIKACSVSNRYIAILAVVCVVGGSFGAGLSWMDLLGGCSIGLGLVGVSILTKEQIGVGDGLVIAALGLLLGTIRTLTILSIASIIMACVSIFFIIIKKGTKKMKLPFLPAISIGYVVCTWL